jgi:hypothetical protein
MSNNAFDMVRKIRHLPGLKLTATLDPTRVSKRIKTAAQKMLRTGVLTSGYASQSRMLAQQVLDDAHVSAVAYNTKWGVRVLSVSRLTKDDRAQIAEFINAARTIELADMRSDAQAPYIHDRYNNILAQFAAHEGEHFSFNLYQSTLQAQIVALISARRTPEQVKAHEALANRLDSTEPFHINF